MLFLYNIYSDNQYIICKKTTLCHMECIDYPPLSLVNSERVGDGFLFSFFRFSPWTANLYVQDDIMGICVMIFVSPTIFIRICNFPNFTLMWAISRRLWIKCHKFSEMMVVDHLLWYVYDELLNLIYNMSKRCVTR